MSNGADIPTPDEPEGPLFTQAASFDQAELLGARWWQARLGQGAPGRRSRPQQRGEEMDRRGFMVIGGIVVAFAAIGGITIALKGRDEPKVSDHDSLQLQRDKGWNVQANKVELQFPSATGRDAVGGSVRVDGLEAALRPQRADLLPFYVPTLFQALQQDSLRRVVVAIQSSAMVAAREKGETVRRIFEQEPAQGATDVALVVDLAGPESVAFAAGLTPRFDAVFTFDNWPHPDGLVPAHLTLAAALFHRRDFDRRIATGARSPCFVLDRARLEAPAGAGRFDNRYVARLPSAERLQSIGVKHVLYVVPAVAPPAELDDLNETFVAWERAGIDVRRLSVGDVVAWRPDAPDPGAPVPSAPGSASREPIYDSYGGRHWWFFRHYPFYAIGSRAPEAPARPSSADYRPSARPTMFTARSLAGGGSGGSSTFGRARYTSYPNRRPSGSSWGRGGGGG
ncbi:MAG: hypothetical protein H6835_03270 [Planctomycetes bacterium]|nr:hypothetical protein [Planctomycetota bacterium]